MIKKIFNTILRDKNLSTFPKTSLIKKLSLLDVGARSGVGYPWNNAKIENLNVILVEPDPEEVELLSQLTQFTQQAVKESEQRFLQQLTPLLTQLQDKHNYS